MNSGPTKARVMDIVESPRDGGGVVSVAVISPDEQRRTAAVKALRKWRKIQIREFADYPSNPGNLSWTLNRDFDAILVDLDSDSKRAMHLVTSICINGLATVIVYSAQDNSELLLQCMRAGAREFLKMPFDPGAVTDALVRASALRSENGLPAKAEEGRLLVFLSAKGGSGVTTLACNIAVTLAQESGRKTLLIDLNLPLGGAAIDLGIKTEHSIADALRNFNRLDSEFLLGLLVKHDSGLFVLAAPGEMASTQIIDEAVDKLLEVALQNFDYVVVDAGSKLNLQHTHLFDVSTTVYLVVQVGLAELRNSNRFISKLSAASSPQLEIVINRYDSHSQEIAEEHITRALTRPVAWKIPNDYTAVRRMQVTAKPLMRDDSEISRAIRQMARSVSGYPAAL